MPTPYQKSVFINCPFDKGYRPLIESLLFVLYFYDFEVKLSITQSSAHDRLEEICKMIFDCKYTFHDLSRHKSKNKNEYARFNMPYEMGIDFGCYRFVKSRKDKIIAMLDSKPHAYDQYLSDMSGRDIIYHKNNPEELLYVVTDWLGRNSDDLFDSQKSIKGYYVAWRRDYKKAAKKNKYNITGDKNRVPLHTYIKMLKSWVPRWKKDNKYTRPS